MANFFKSLLICADTEYKNHVLKSQQDSLQNFQRWVQRKLLNISVMQTSMNLPAQGLEDSMYRSNAIEK